MNIKQIIQDYFTFSRNERKGITVLLILIFLFGIANKLLFYFETPAKIDMSLFDSASQRLGFISDSMSHSSNDPVLFRFDPNTIDSISLWTVDLPEKVKINLLKFRNKGGRFYCNADFRTFYGVNDSIYERVAPYLDIEEKQIFNSEVSPEPDLFEFDPNSATDDQYSRLGFSEKQIQTIRAYIAKIGFVKSKVEFFKIRVINEQQKRRLADYIVIEGPNKPDVKHEVDVIGSSKIDLNMANPEQLKVLPGIGDLLSVRIVKYRDLLGGFYSVNQLKEVYGLKEETIVQIENLVIVDVLQIRKLNLNFSDAAELSKHPYIKKNLANRIVQFRSKYGKVDDLRILKDSMILNIDDYRRLKPYF